MRGGIGDEKGATRHAAKEELTASAHSANASVSWSSVPWGRRSESRGDEGEAGHYDGDDDDEADDGDDYEHHSWMNDMRFHEQDKGAGGEDEEEEEEEEGSAYGFRFRQSAHRAFDQDGGQIGQPDEEEEEEEEDTSDASYMSMEWITKQLRHLDQRQRALTNSGAGGGTASNGSEEDEGGEYDDGEEDEKEGSTQKQVDLNVQKALELLNGDVGLGDSRHTEDDDRFSNDAGEEAGAEWNDADTFSFDIVQEAMTTASSWAPASVQRRWEKERAQEREWTRARIQEEKEEEEREKREKEREEKHHVETMTETKEETKEKEDATEGMAASDASKEAETEADQWLEAFTAKGRVYYYNRRTRESSWTMPASLVPLNASLGTSKASSRGDGASALAWSRASTVPVLEGDSSQHSKSMASSGGAGASALAWSRASTVPVLEGDSSQLGLSMISSPVGDANSTLAWSRASTFPILEGESSQLGMSMVSSRGVGANSLAWSRASSIPLLDGEASSRSTTPDKIDGGASSFFASASMLEAATRAPVSNGTDQGKENPDALYCCFCGSSLDGANGFRSHVMSCTRLLRHKRSASSLYADFQEMLCLLSEDKSLRAMHYASAYPDATPHQVSSNPCAIRKSLTLLRRRKSTSSASSSLSAAAKERTHRRRTIDDRAPSAHSLEKSDHAVQHQPHRLPPPSSSSLPSRRSHSQERVKVKAKPSAQLRLRMNGPQTMETCRHCRRSFAEGRLAKHEAVCPRVFGNETSWGRGQTSATSKPLPAPSNGYHAEKGAPSRARSTSKTAPGHTLALSFKEHQASLVECPCCRRKFAPSGAQQHIDICKTVQHRPRNPVPLMKDFAIAG